MYENLHKQQVPTPAPTLVNPSPSNAGKKREIISTLAIIIIAPLIALFLTVFVFQSYEVDGPSMETTLHDNDRLLVNKMPVTWSKISRQSFTPSRYDIVIFNHTDNYGNSITEKQLIKRVIGLPGDRVVIKNGATTIYNNENPDGFNVDQNGPEAKAIKRTSGNVDLVVKEGTVFLMGDNRENSLDSRVFGPVDSQDIVGTLSFRIYPFSQFTKF
jgi:signal peptidase I